jgi:hypothetical protein
VAKYEVTILAQGHEIAGCQLELRMQMVGHHMVHLERGYTVACLAFLLLLEVLAPYR